MAKKKTTKKKTTKKIKWIKPKELSREFIKLDEPIKLIMRSKKLPGSEYSFAELKDYFYGYPKELVITHKIIIIIEHQNHAFKGDRDCRVVGYLTSGLFYSSIIQNHEALILDDLYEVLKK